MAAKTLEEIAKELKKMKFKSALFGGVDKKDVWKKIERLNDDYMQYIEQQRIGYEAVIADKDRMIANGITVSAAQVAPMAPENIPPIGQLPPQGFDPAMMPQEMAGMLPPQGFDPGVMPQEMAGMLPPPGFDPAMTGMTPPYGAEGMMPMGVLPTDLPPGFDPALMGLVPMFDEEGNPLPVPMIPPYDAAMAPPQGFDPGMMPPQGFDPAMAPPQGFEPAEFEPNWDPLPSSDTPREGAKPSVPPYEPGV